MLKRICDKASALTANASPGALFGFAWVGSWLVVIAIVISITWVLQS